MIVSNIIGHGHVCRALKNRYCEIFRKGVNDSTSINLLNNEKSNETIMIKMSTEIEAVQNYMQ